MNLRKPLVGALFALISFGAFAAVDVNKADQAELETVKGLGPAMSGKIVDARKTGPYKDWQDLQSRVKGIGPGSSAKLSNEGLTVNGAAFGAAAEPQQVSKAKPGTGTTKK